MTLNKHSFLTLIVHNINFYKSKPGKVDQRCNKANAIKSQTLKKSENICTRKYALDFFHTLNHALI